MGINFSDIVNFFMSKMVDKNGGQKYERYLTTFPTT